jgi:hypothetical protein
VKHNKADRPCTAWDLLIVSGGLQCGNCLATDVPPIVTCSAPASDGPCPLPPDGSDGLCWVHRMQASQPEKEGR